MIMEAGFSSYAIGWAVAAREPGGRAIDAFDVIDLARELGYRRLQLADNVPLHSLTEAQRAALLQHTRAAGIAVEVGTRGLTRENLAAYLPIATQFASPFLRIVIDSAGYEPGADQVIALLKEHAPALERAGVILAIENHDRFKSAELARMLETVGSRWVGICLDTANSFGAGEDIHTVVNHLGPHTVNVHLKDIRIVRVPYLQGFVIEGVPLGTGQIPIEWVLSEAARHGRCLTATLEHWVPPEPDMADTVRKEREWCTRSTVTMRRLFPHSFAPGVT